MEQKQIAGEYISIYSATQVAEQFPSSEEKFQLVCFFFTTKIQNENNSPLKICNCHCFQRKSIEWRIQKLATLITHSFISYQSNIQKNLDTLNDEILYADSRNLRQETCMSQLYSNDNLRVLLLILIKGTLIDITEIKQCVLLQLKIIQKSTS